VLAEAAARRTRSARPPPPIARECEEEADADADADAAPADAADDTAAPAAWEGDEAEGERSPPGDMLRAGVAAVRASNAFMVAVWSSYMGRAYIRI
jgi:hypothetical protein